MHLKLHVYVSLHVPLSHDCTRLLHRHSLSLAPSGRHHSRTLARSLATQVDRSHCRVRGGTLSLKLQSALFCRPWYGAAASLRFYPIGKSGTLLHSVGPPGMAHEEYESRRLARIWAWDARGEERAAACDASRSKQAHGDEARRRVRREG